MSENESFNVYFISLWLISLDIEVTLLTGK